MDDTVQTSTPLDPNPLDNSSANDALVVESGLDLSKYAEQSLGGGEKTPRKLPEVHTQPMLAPDQQQAIALETRQDLADTRSRLAQEVVNDQREAAIQQEVVEQTQKFQLFHSLVDRANQLREGKFAEASTTMVACAMAMLPLVLEQKGISTAGMVDAAINIGPGALMGATMGKHLEPLNRMIGKDLDELKGVKAKAVKAGNMLTGAALGAAVGQGGGMLSHAIGAEKFRGFLNLADDIAVPALKAASKAKEGATYLRQRVSSFRRTKEPTPSLQHPLQQSEA
jgi:hypothetical protein